MKLTGDLQSAKLIYLKGFLFLVTGLLSVAALLLDSPTLRTAFLLLIALWSFCRLYYFMFYVIEKYVDPVQVRWPVLVPALPPPKAGLTSRASPTIPPENPSLKTPPWCLSAGQFWLYYSVPPHPEAGRTGWAIGVARSQDAGAS